MNIAFDMSFERYTSRHQRSRKDAKRLIRAIQKEKHRHEYHFFRPDSETGAEEIPVQLERFVRDRQIDVLQIADPLQLLYVPFDRVNFGKTKVAVHVQDLFQRFAGSAGHLSPEMKAAYQKALQFIRTCDVIMAGSASSQQEAARILAISPESVRVVNSGAGRHFRQMRVHVRDLHKYGIDRPYVTATVDVIDQELVSSLVEAFHRANRRLGGRFQLVLTECSDGAKPESRLAQENPSLDSAEVLCLGHLPDRQLAELYGGSELFVYPSVHEGTGLYVLDAMACGTPVLALSRLFGDGRSYAHAALVESMEQALTTCLEDEEWKTAQRSKGFEQIEHGRSHAADVAALQAYKYALRPKLAVFAPLAPIQSGIADYMSVLLPVLCEQYECDLFIDEGYRPELPPDVTSELSGRVFRHNEFWNRAGRYDQVVYQLANSKHHAYMVPYVRSFPGVVILHDLHVPELAEEWRRRVPGGQQSYTLSDYLDKAHAIIVHSEYMKRYLNRIGHRNVGINRLPQKLPVMISLVMERDFVFSSFGSFSDRNKLELVIRCLRRLYEDGVRDIRYTVLGTGSPEYMQELKALVGSLGLESVVEFQENAKQARYESGICHSDVCIQLSSATDADYSLTLLDLLSHGKAVIVSNVESNEELPDEAVCKVPHDEQLEDRLYITMSQLYKDKQLRKQLRQKARRYVSDHHPVAGYVDNLKGIVEDGGLDEVQEAFEEEPKTEPAASDQDTPAEFAAGEAPSQEAEQEDASEHQAADGRTRTVLLRPNRYRRIKTGASSVSYFSFNLSELPAGCTIQSAVMHIHSYAKVLRIHRIRAGWTAAGVSRKKPLVRKFPIYKKAVKPLSKSAKSTLFKWECTGQAVLWQQDQLHNHGVFVPRVSLKWRPRLQLVISE